MNEPTPEEDFSHTRRDVLADTAANTHDVTLPDSTELDAPVEPKARTGSVNITWAVLDVLTNPEPLA